MPFRKAFLLLMFWIFILGILNFGLSFFYPNDGYTIPFSWLSFGFMSVLSISALLFAKLIILLKPKINLTVVVFGILSFRFLFTLFFFGIYYFMELPQGKIFVLPFMTMFFYFLFIENYYLLKYANYVFETTQRNS